MKTLINKIISFLANGSGLKDGGHYVVLKSNL